jgi:uncharacterized membrane protein YqjE
MREFPEPDPPASHRPSWREAAADFVSARVELIAFEAKEAKKHAAGKAVLVVIILACAVVAYLTILAGAIGWIASTGAPWYFVTLGAALLHLLVAGIAVALLKRPLPPAFTHTKAELAKDREWLINKKNPSWKR